MVCGYCQQACVNYDFVVFLGGGAILESCWGNFENPFTIFLKYDGQLLKSFWDDVEIMVD